MTNSLDRSHSAVRYTCGNRAIASPHKNPGQPPRTGPVPVRRGLAHTPARRLDEKEPWPFGRGSEIIMHSGRSHGPCSHGRQPSSSPSLFALPRPASLRACLRVSLPPLRP
jgi:hypothetical protein